MRCSGHCVRFAALWCWWFGGSMVRFYWRWWRLQETKGKSAPWRRQKLHRHKLTKGIFPPQSFPPGSPVYQYWNLQCQWHLCATWRCGGTAAIALPDRSVCAADRFLNHTLDGARRLPDASTLAHVGTWAPRDFASKRFLCFDCFGCYNCYGYVAQARAADTVYWVPLPKYVVADTLWLDWPWLSLLIAFSSTCPRVSLLLALKQELVRPLHGFSVGQSCVLWPGPRQRSNRLKRHRRWDSGFVGQDHALQECR